MTKKLDVEKKPKKVKPKKDEKLWQFKCYGGLFKKLVARVIPLSTEIKLNITKNGLSMIVVDPSHVCMVTLEIPRKDFYLGTSCINKEVAYKVKEDFEIGIDLEKLDKTLKLFSDYDHVTGYIQNNKLYLDSDDIHKKLGLLSTAGMPDAKVPNLEFGVDGEVSCNKMALLMKACDNNDFLTLIADKTGLHSMIEEDDDDLRIDLTKDVKGEGKAIYSCDYFGNMVKGLSQWKTLQLQYSTDNPMRLSGEIGDSGVFEYLLAPRIKSE